MPLSPHQLFQALQHCVDPNQLTVDQPMEKLDIEGLSFLVAEDNKVNQMVISGILSKHGAKSIPQP